MAASSVGPCASVHHHPRHGEPQRHRRTTRASSPEAQQEQSAFRLLRLDNLALHRRRSGSDATPPLPEHGIGPITAAVAEHRHRSASSAAPVARLPRSTAPRTHRLSRSVPHSHREHRSAQIGRWISSGSLARASFSCAINTQLRGWRLEKWSRFIARPTLSWVRAASGSSSSIAYRFQSEQRTTNGHK